jgi:hypothetical protein
MCKRAVPILGDWIAEEFLVSSQVALMITELGVK